jgi:hypothetical protein
VRPVPGSCWTATRGVRYTPAMRRHSLTLVLAVISVIGCCVWAPWVQVDAAFPTASTSLGVAPLWTKNFQYFPGARVDVRELAMHISLAIIFAALIALAQAIRHFD